MGPISKIFLLFLGITSLFILVRWWEKIAQKNLEGKYLPDEIDLNLKNPDGVIYYFYHPRCGPCKTLTPLIDELKQRYPDRVEKINIADRQDLALAFAIRVTPTTVMVKNNKIIKAIIGYTSPKKLASLFDANNSEGHSR
jgi:thioredoxin 1